MGKGFISRGVLHWMRVPKNHAEVRLDEWILAFARLVLSVGCAAAAFLNRGGNGTAGFSAGLLELYGLYSIAMVLVLHFRPHLNPLAYIGIHLLDIVWAANLSIVIGWPALLFALFLFVLTSAAFRWGFWECVFTMSFMYLLQALVSLIYGLRFPMASTLKLPYQDELVCLVLGLIIGLLAEAKALRGERFAIGRILEEVRLESGLEKAIQVVCMEGMRLYGPTQILVAMRRESMSEFLWFRAIRSEPLLQSGEIKFSEQGQYFFPAPAESWRIVSSHLSGQPRFKRFLLEAGKIKKEKIHGPLPQNFLSAYPFRVLLSASIDLKPAWNARVFVIDPLPIFGGNAGLRYLDRSLRKVAPVIHDLFLVERVKSKVEAATAGRIARELHDGAIQALTAITFQIEELQEQESAAVSQIAEPLAQILECIRNEIKALREFSQRLRSLDIDSGRLVGYLSGLAAKFQCEYGIEARFVSEAEEVHLSPQVCSELARILQEALVNVKKHSGASSVFVHFGSRDGNWILSVIDNGCGFGFSGRRCHDDLQASGTGPAVIMERASGINGSVCIESIQGQGTRLEISIPG